jgi:hypothetical protein
MLHNGRRRSGDGSGGWWGNHGAKRRRHGAEEFRRAGFRIRVKDPRSDHDAVFPGGVLSHPSLGPERHAEGDDRRRQQRDERLRGGAQAALDRRRPRQRRGARELAIDADISLGGSCLLPLFAARLASALLAVAAEGTNRAYAASDVSPRNHHSLCRSTASSDPIVRTLQATPRQHAPSPTSLRPNVAGSTVSPHSSQHSASRDIHPTRAAARLQLQVERRPGADPDRRYPVGIFRTCPARSRLLSRSPFAT